MTRALIPIATGLTVAAATVAVYWLGGGDFERGPALAGTAALALYMGIVVGGVVAFIRIDV